MIGNKIKELRAKFNITQKELAEVLYVTPQAISRWETGKVEPSLATVVEIAKFFHINTDELLEVR